MYQQSKVCLIENTLPAGMSAGFGLPTSLPDSSVVNSISQQDNGGASFVNMSAKDNDNYFEN